MKSFLPSAVALTVALMFFAGSPLAQDRLPAKPVILHATIITVGQQVRTGYLYDLTDSALLISDKKGLPRSYDSSGGARIQSIGYKDLRYVELAKKGVVWRRTLIGFGIGAAVGALIGVASGDDPKDQWFSFSAGEKAAGGALLGGGIGGISGLISGLAARKTFHIRGRRENYDRMRKKIVF